MDFYGNDKFGRFASNNHNKYNKLPATDVKKALIGNGRMLVMEEVAKEMDIEINQITMGYDGTISIECSAMPKMKEEKMNFDRIRKIYPKTMLKKMGIERIIFNDDATIVFLKSGVKGVAKRDTQDTFDPVIGIGIAYAVAMATDGNKTQFKENVWKLYDKGEYTVK